MGDLQVMLRIKAIRPRKRPREFAGGLKSLVRAIRWALRKE
jgi:hypothetical protein